MKLFLDTADCAAIEKWVATGLIDGVTTNPSHLYKSGGDPKKIVLAICALIPDGDVSVEVTEIDPNKVYAQAKEIAALAPNVVVKIPCHILYYPIIKKLVEQEVAVNVTLVFTLLQGLMMSKIGVDYISPFIGRWDDLDIDGMPLLQELREMMDQYEFDTQILAASVRHVRHLHEIVVAGVDVATVPVDVLERATTHVLTDQGIAKFKADWQKLGVKQFP